MSSKTEADRGVAVVGMGCRFPAARSVDEYWRLLREGRHGVSEVAALDPWDRERAAGLRHAALLGEIAGFDAAFFRISPREAEGMDPQQRLLMEVSWHALEDAGIVPSRLSGTDAGVYVGISGSGYALQSAALPGRPDATRLTGALCSIAANRLSYFFGVHGPSLAVDTACSSSLVAIHLACEGLERGDADLALAGGVSLILDSFVSRTLAQAGVLSAEGRCKTFDEGADGYVRGEGAAMLVLRPLAAARADGDRIYAVIRGGAVNQDGPSNGLTAPNRVAQERVIARAWERAGVEPSRADYVEAHGTGTLLGDPIEARALANTVGRGRAGGACRVGASKTNLGHLEAAAGAAGVVKCCLMMHHGSFVPSLNFERCNPYIPLERLHLAVETQYQPWPLGERGSRLAGVSSFGIGGTNAHLVIESAPSRRRDRRASSLHPLLVLAAASAPALEELKARHSDLLEVTPAEDLIDLCHAAATQREPLSHRFAAAAGSAEEMRQRLIDPAPAPNAVRGEPRIAFLFTGQGSQRPGMGGELFEREPVFRHSLERCAEALDGELDRPLLDVMLGSDEAMLAETIYSQPATFAFQFALAAVWDSWGIRPAAVLGHSVGELAAACVAGVLGLEDALRLVAARGRAMQESSPEGAMVAALVGEEEARALLSQGSFEVEIAAVNSPRQIVFSGPTPEIERLATYLAEREVTARRLEVRRAFHSALLEPALPAFERRIRGLEYRAPRLPYYSNVTGGLAGEEIATAAYWVRQARSTTRFADCARALVEAGCDALLEIGGTPVLLPLVRETVGPRPAGFPSLRPGASEAHQMAAALGALFECGAAPDWNRFFGEPARRVIGLPRCPFQRRRYWLSEEDAGGAVLDGPGLGGPTPTPLPERRLPLAGGDPWTLVTSRLASVTGHQPSELEAGTRLENLGLSSIGLVELAALLAEDLPMLEEGEPAWAGARTVGELVELISRALPTGSEGAARASAVRATDRSRESAAREGGNRVFILTESPGTFRRPANRLLKSVRSAAGGLEAELVVDPSHPFFFDHPYDHVPGVLFVEAVQQLSEWVAAAIDGDPMRRLTWFDRLDMQFERWADLDEPLRIAADRLVQRGSAWHLDGSIGGERRCARFKGSFGSREPEAWDEPLPERSPPAEARLVHKRRPENILISRPVATGDAYEAQALEPTAGHPLCDGPGELVPVTQVAEWTRQFLTARAHLEQKGSFDEHFILLSLRVRMKGALRKHERAQLWSPALREIDASSLRMGGARVELRRGERSLGQVELYGAATDEGEYERARWGELD